jgi:glycosyltransferase involved in cell wall biosynthesis
MRVVQLGAYPPPHGGVQTNVVGLLRFLRERGASCAVVNLTRHRRASGDGVFYPRTALEVLGLLLRLRADVLHLHVGGDLTLRLAGLALLCGLLPGRRAVLTFHSGGYPSSPGGRRARPRSFRGFALRRLDALIAVNHEVADVFVRFGVPSERIHMIEPFAVRPPADPAGLPEPLQGFFRAHDPVLTTVGGLEPEYDVGTSIAALGRLRERYPNAGLVVVGGGSLERDLRRTLDSLAFGRHVLLCGDVPHATTLRAIAKSDLLLRTTLYDGDSIAVREALFLGTPVVATDNGMRPAGCDLVPTSDPDALCRCIERRLTRGREAVGRASAGEENLEAVLHLYERLVTEADRRRATRVVPTRIVATRSKEGERTRGALPADSGRP